MTTETIARTNGHIATEELPPRAADLPEEALAALDGAEQAADWPADIWEEVPVRPAVKLRTQYDRRGRPSISVYVDGEFQFSLRGVDCAPELAQLARALGALVDSREYAA